MCGMRTGGTGKEQKWRPQTLQILGVQRTVLSFLLSRLSSPPGTRPLLCFCFARTMGKGEVLSCVSLSLSFS